MNRKIRYISNGDSQVRGPRGYELDKLSVIEAVHRTRDLIAKLDEFEVDVFAILGMRNLSSFLGEVFAASMKLEFPGLLEKNPHQDGYPDLLLMDTNGLDAWGALKGRLQEKAPFSPFPTGGFEVKATCGAVPTPAVCARRGFTKPDIGDQRIEVATGYDWKAHHRETNNLFGLHWDFVDGIPTITAVFYSDELNEGDWGSIVQPKVGGGRTTSVSIMTRGGIKKMYDGWICVIDDPIYAKFFDRRNDDLQIQRAFKI
jgi:hypothetical protein